jgi:hypothetical protein
MLEFAISKDKLPPYTDLKCSICLDIIDLDELDEHRVPNCVICENGHRLHNVCFTTYNITTTDENRNKCPLCKNGKGMTFCKSRLDYSYASRKGGKKRRTNKNIKKIHKKTTYKKRYYKSKKHL